MLAFHVLLALARFTDKFTISVRLHPCLALANTVYCQRLVMYFCYSRIVIVADSPSQSAPCPGSPDSNSIPILPNSVSILSQTHPTLVFSLLLSDTTTSSCLVYLG